MYASDHKLEVNPEQFGADLIDANNNHHELKVSICKHPKYSCNFNWHIPKAATDDERRQKLLTSIKQKTKGGAAVLVVRNGKGLEMVRYKLCESFLLGYFERIKLGKCNNHNMGCSYCSKCETFHRLDRMQLMSTMLEKSSELTEEAWDAVFAPTKTCAK